MSLAADLEGKLPRNPLRLIPVTCVSDSPLTVLLAGMGDAVPARTMAGSTFAPGETGMALWQPPLAPICFKTT